MTPRQMYRELLKLTRVRGTDGEPLLVTERLGKDGLHQLVQHVLAFLEKLDAQRARHDFRSYYAMARSRAVPRRRRESVDGSTEQERPSRYIHPDDDTMQGMVIDQAERDISAPLTAHLAEGLSHMADGLFGTIASSSIGEPPELSSENLRAMRDSLAGYRGNYITFDEEENRP